MFVVCYLVFVGVSVFLVEGDILIKWFLWIYLLGDVMLDGLVLVYYFLGIREEDFV